MLDTSTHYIKPNTPIIVVLKSKVHQSTPYWNQKQYYTKTQSSSLWKPEYSYTQTPSKSILVLKVKKEVSQNVPTWVLVLKISTWGSKNWKHSLICTNGSKNIF
jgi:hypothetical protein